MPDLQAWLTERVEADERLYEQFGKPLEASHPGEYVAIGPDGRTIVGTSDVEVLEQAIQTFGSGNFALRRLGRRTFGRWLTLPA
jgi:hypothetical protein